MVNILVRLHPSIRIDGEPWKFEGNFDGIPIIEAINILLEPHPKVAELCLHKTKRKPGLLYISNKTELASLGLLDEIIDEDIEIRLVPILHGG